MFYRSFNINERRRKIGKLLIPSIILFCFSPCFGFELIVLGDSRSDFGNKNFQRTEAIINDAIEYTEGNYDELVGIVMTGDYVNSGKNVDEWERWREVNERAFEYPIYPCIGNHDDEHTDCPWWSVSCEIDSYYNWNYYQTFGVERWWSVDIEGLHLVSLDSNLEEFEESSLEGDLLEMYQYDWFEDDLKKNEDKLTIVIWHDPAYGSYTWFKMGHGSNSLMRERYVSLCEKYKVDMVMYGHNHWYERVAVNGIVHLTTGGGGAPLLPKSLLPRDKVEGSEINIPAFHWCIVSVSDEAVKVDVIKYKTHKVLDSFEIVIGEEGG